MARVRQSGVAKTPWSPALHRPRDSHFSARTHLFINGMMASPVVVLREKLVDETDWILPTSFLALDQSLPLGIASTGSAAFSFMTIDPAVGHGVNRRRCPFRAFPVCSTEPAPANLDYLRVCGPLTCPHPCRRNLSADHVVFEQVHQGHPKCFCSENPCSTECTNTCRDIRSGLRSRCRSFREINRARNKAGFGLEGGKMWVESSLSCPPASHGEEDRQTHPLYTM